MADKSIVGDGLQRLRAMSKQKGFAKGDGARKVVNVYQNQKGAQNALLGNATCDRKQVRRVTIDADEM